MFVMLVFLFELRVVRRMAVRHEVLRVKSAIGFCFDVLILIKPVILSKEEGSEWTTMLDHLRGLMEL